MMIPYTPWTLGLLYIHSVLLPPELFRFTWLLSNPPIHTLKGHSCLMIGILMKPSYVYRAFICRLYFVSTSLVGRAGSMWNLSPHLLHKKPLGSFHPNCRLAASLGKAAYAVETINQLVRTLKDTAAHT